MRNFFWLFIAIAFLSSCGNSIDVVSDMDQATDFTAFQTCEMLPWNAANDSLINDLNKDRLVNSLAIQFALRNVEMVDGKADIAIGINVVFEEKQSTRAYTDYYSMGGYGYYPSFGYGTSTTRYETYEYLVGTMIIDVFDTQTKKLVWQGIGIGVVEKNPKNPEKQINKYVGSILRQYPIKAKEIK